MQLYFLRHADAEVQAPTDALRPLSEKGIEQAHRVGRFCVEREVRLSLILHSPLKRTQQTAQYVAEITGAPLELAPWLASGMSPYQGLEELKAYRTESS